MSRAICASAASRFSIGGCVAKSSAAPFFTDVGMMKNAFIASTSRRSRDGIRWIVPAIFWSALIRCSGAPVMRAAPRSAPYSRYREIVRMRT